jgi:aspartokinase/homoserine dehydrogenase 1
VTKLETSQKKWLVHKFGGTSVQTAERMVNAAKIIVAEKLKHPDHGSGVVVSAMKGTTDGLIELTQLARAKNPAYLEKLNLLKQRHLDTLDALKISELKSVIENDFKDVREILRGVELVQSVSERIVEYISGYGEIWSAQILAAYLNTQKTPARYLDAREVLVVKAEEPNESPGKSRVVEWDASLAKLNAKFKAWGYRGEILVITGFVASTPDGIATTLKRNGSDFSGSIFGKLLSADAITIWTDVDGVLSADPRLVPDAVVLEEMSYHEVTELANFGAKVVHPATMEPAIRDGIPVWIRNTFNPTHPGTKIHAQAKSNFAVKGFSAIEKMALINMEGNGMVGVSGVAERLFGALRTAGISVVMISQASSEHSISIAVSESEAARAKSVIETAFYAEIHQGALDRVEVKPGKSILAAVGDNMVETPGIAGQFFAALGRAGVSINSIAQGASERNISAVIDGAQTSLALRAVHSSFYLSPQTIGIGLIGNGTIGKEFLKQLQTQLPLLKERYGLDLRVRGILTSKKMRLDGKDERGIEPSQWGELNEDANQEAWLKHVHSQHLPHSILIDATSSDEFPKLYSTWLKKGFHLITPNKKLNAGPFSAYAELRATALQAKRRFFYSTNVGGGLPILQTVRDFFQTGDRLISAEGVLSGTLSHLFNSFDGKKEFSELVLEAKKLGYTEPDPRDDLSGMDVARKLVIIAREAGLSLELADIPVENLVPKELQSIPLADYLSKLKQGDALMRTRLESAQAKNEVLRYVGVIDEKGKASVQLKSFPKTHALASLSGADNLVSFKTTRYHTRPLVIQGPGAGPEVTAAGVFADLLRLTATLGAPT